MGSQVRMSSPELSTMLRPVTIAALLLWLAAPACGTPSDAASAGAAEASSSVATGTGAGGGAPGTVKLSVTVTGAGSGKVTADAGGIACSKGGGTCGAVYSAGAKVTLTATPDPGYVFHGWAGAGCTVGAKCVVTADSDKSVRAAFVMVVFQSARKLDGSDAATPGGTANIWTVRTDGAGLVPVTNLTAVKVANEQPQWSPDGNTIVFASSRKLDGTDAANANLTFNIWTMKPDGTQSTPLTTMTAVGADSGAPQWSPDGARVAFFSSRKVDGTHAANTNNSFNIWTVKVDGTAAAPLTKAVVGDANSLYPVWSPDGGKLAFMSSRKLDGSDAGNLQCFNNIWVVAPDGAGLSPITMLTASTCSPPSWSPDGSKILFASTRKLDGTDAVNSTGVFNIWAIRLDGTSLTHLTTLTAPLAHNDAPEWSADGNHVVFVGRGKLDGSDAANSSLTSNMWIVGADGSGATPLTKATAPSAGSAAPRWSPDGASIVFYSQLKLDGSDASNMNATRNVWLMKPDGTGLAPLTKTTASGADNVNPQW